MKVDVRDRRSHGWFAVYREDLERLAAACEPRQRASVRSVYLALLDAANEGRSEACALSRRELAARAGVGPKGLTSAVEALERAGLLEVESGQNNGSTNVWTLLSPEEGGGSAKTQGVGQQRPRGWVSKDPGGGSEMTHPMVTKEEVRRTKKEEEPHKALGNVSQTSLSVDESRVERFYEWHRERVRDRAQASPPRTAAALKAARSLLAREPCATVIQERLDFALGRPFWASKVLSLVDLDRYFAAITAEHLAVKERRNGREDTSVSDPDYPVSTDYGGVRS